MILSFDIGGTKTRVSLLEEMRPFADPVWQNTFESFYEYQDLLNYLSLLSKRNKSDLTAVGISFGVSYSQEGRKVLAAGKMENFVGRNIADDFEAILKCRAVFAHDCISALIAEQEFSKFEGSMAYVTISSGVGGAVLLRKDEEKLFMRTRMAHQIIEMNGEICKCGQTGCLATYLDGKEIEKRSGVKPTDIVDEQFWSTFTMRLAVGLVNLSWMYPVRKIIIGGGIVMNNVAVKERIQDEFYSLRKKGNQYDCLLEFPRLGEASPLIGAAVLACNKGLKILYS